MMKSLLKRIRQRFLLGPAGFGRPLDRSVLDREYTTGAWDHFRQAPELSRQILVAGLVAHWHPQPRVLDVGCGSGKFAELLLVHRPFRYLGFDLSPAGLEIARQQGLAGCEFEEGNLETWASEELFDVIVFNEVLGYASDPAQVLARMSRQLVPNGHLVLSVFRSGHWEALWRRSERAVNIIHATTVTNDKGQTWDIRVAEPKVRSEGPSPS
jgi:2-polyprenyl-3-methyl-5-hydroxy-6-metoxy-1,4-benzoquinol methylase